jgi:hypothetical protein
MTTALRVFGYMEDNKVDRHEGSIVRMIFYMYVVCELSHQQIAFHLNRLNIAGPGQEWTDILVYELLTNPAYIGLDGSEDILQDVEAWEAAQKPLVPESSTAQ